MRFKLEQNKIGAIRYKKCFSFFPRKIGNVRIWLERYYVKQEWSQEYEYLGFAGLEVTGRGKWRNKYELLSDAPELAPLNRALE
jgi:hypothetical protein